MLHTPIANQIRNEFLKTNFPLEKVITDKKKFFEPLTLFTKETIQDSSKYCMICHKKTKHPGIHPPICKKIGCMNAHEKYGLGVDLESEIKENPQVLDLLLCFAYSAAIENVNSTSFDSFNPYPNFEVDGKRAFVKGDKKLHQKVADTINKIPKASKLITYIEEGVFKEKCDEISKYIYPFLRWLFASNRSYISFVPKKEATFTI